MQSRNKTKKDTLQILTKHSTILQHQGKFLQAKNLLKKALNIAPRDPVVLFDLGNLYRAQKNEQRAIEFYEKACNLSSNPIFMQELEKYKKLIEK